MNWMVPPRLLIFRKQGGHWRMQWRKQPKARYKSTIRISIWLGTEWPEPLIWQMIPVSAAKAGPNAKGPLGPGKVLRFNMVSKKDHSGFVEMAGIWWSKWWFRKMYFSNFYFAEKHKTYNFNYQKRAAKEDG